MSAVRLKDIAEACGVSTATVSRALNRLSQPDNKAAEMIRKRASEMGYIPNAAALALKTNQSNNIGILYEANLYHEYFSTLLDALRREAGRRGYDLTLIGSEGEEGTNYYDHARKRNVDGVIVIQADFDSAEVIRLATSSMPSVIIDHMYEGCDCVGNDNRASMSQIVQYAWQRGHRRIAYIIGEHGAVTKERLAGFYKACAELGICVPKGSVVEGHFHEPKECADHIRRLIREPEAPTCILCPDDYSCLGAMLQLSEESVNVPEQVSLIGYDGIRIGQMISPKLTTYRQEPDEIAAEAINLLIEAIEEPETHNARQIIVNGSLIRGETVKEIPR